MTTRFVQQDVPEEEVELFQDEDGNVVDADGNVYEEADDETPDEDLAISDLDPEELTDDDWQQLMEPVVIEAMLDGRLPCPDEEFEEALAAGFELGIVVETENGGLALARDLEVAEGLALAQQSQRGLALASVGSGAKYAGNFARAFGGGNVGAARTAATGMKAFKRAAAKSIGRARTYAREGAARAGHIAKTVARDPFATGYLGAVGGAHLGYRTGRLDERSGRRTRSPLVSDAARRREAAAPKK
jgi:hypothetical protein